MNQQTPKKKSLFFPATPIRKGVKKKKMAKKGERERENS